MLCSALIYYAVLCYAMLCYAMLCYAMLCYAVLGAHAAARRDAHARNSAARASGPLGLAAVVAHGAAHPQPPPSSCGDGVLLSTFPIWQALRILKMAGATLDEAGCAPECHAFPRSELHGHVVRCIA
jgi:hypothetical protein